MVSSEDRRPHYQKLTSPAVRTTPDIQLDFAAPTKYFSIQTIAAKTRRRLHGLTLFELKHTTWRQHLRQPGQEDRSCLGLRFMTRSAIGGFPLS